jgi:hypothetical protein
MHLTNYKIQFTIHNSQYSLYILHFKLYYKLNTIHDKDSLFKNIHTPHITYYPDLCIIQKTRHKMTTEGTCQWHDTN